MAEKTVLVVCTNTQYTASLKSLLEGNRECSVRSVSTSVAGRSLARDVDFDVIIINSPLESGLGDEFANTLARITYSALLILVPEQIEENMKRKTAGIGAHIITKPLKKSDFLSAYDTAVLSSERSKVLYLENQKLKRKIRELKTIERAKVLLVEYLKLSEDQAHKYIEKQAMERRLSAGEVAQGIINTYEN